MESGRRSSSLKRKPLADCTNTVASARRKSSQSAAKPSETAIKPLKTSNSSANKFNFSPKLPTSSGSVKSNTSTGSNNPPNVNSVLSIPYFSDPPAPPTPLYDAGGRDRRKFGLSTAKSQRDEKTRKVKGKISSEAPIIQASKVTVQQAPLRFSSDASGSPAVHNKLLDAQKRKDKGMMVLEIPNIETTDLLRPHVLLTSSAASGNCHLSRPPLDENQKLDAQRSDKEKMVLETPNIEKIDLLRSHISLPSSSAASGNFHLSVPPEVQNQNLDALKRREKGKMVLDTPNFETTDLLRPHISLPSSSAASGSSHLSGPPAIQNQELDAQKRKDKGKMIVETPFIETTDLFRPHISLPSSSSASGNFHLSWPPAVESLKLDAKKRKDIGKRVVENLNIRTSESLRLHVPLASSSAIFDNCPLSGNPTIDTRKLDSSNRKDKGNLVQATLECATTDPWTPHALLASSSANSGTRDQEKPVSWTVYNLRRASLRRKPTDETLSSPPKKRTKKMGLELSDDCDNRISGSHTDPLPLRKKQSRKKHVDSVHTMPQDEVERLNAYYAEIDAFELPEEVISDSE